MVTVGINGFGRIGRCFTRLALGQDQIDVALVNDLAPIEELAHLLKYDSSQGTLQIPFTKEDNSLVFSNGKRITFSQFATPEEIPWKSHNVTDVLESSGKFLSKEKASGHLKAGAVNVVISAPGEEDVPTMVMGITSASRFSLGNIVSNASCTTNSAAPMIKVIESLSEIEMGHLATVHSYTSDQRLQDAPHRDLRRARAATHSIIPTTTGATRAIMRIFPHLEGKLTGSSVRVPVINGSLTELTLVTKRPLSKEEINEAMMWSSAHELAGILGVSEDPIVSCDVIGSPYSCLFDPNLTTVAGRLIRISGWYDNEMGYSARLIDLFQQA